MTYLRKKQGITLISLVITIIVLLILAGVSIATLTGENGIITQAIKSKEQTQIASEREAIEVSLISNKLTQSEESKIGITLYDKTMENSTIWDIIVLNEHNSVYGTDWNYIEKNIEINHYGETKYEWLVNYNTGEIICLNDEEYTRLTHGVSLGVTDGLIFSLDPSVIDNTDLESLQNGNTSILGKNVELMNFNWTNDSGLTPTTFNFDGINDYIKVGYDNTEEKNILAQNGFTFEYYGVLSEGTSYNANGTIRNDTYNGIFCYWNGIETSQASFRLGLRFEQFLIWNASSGNYSVSDYSSESGTPWNIKYPLEDYKSGDEIYYTITLDTSNVYERDEEEYYKQVLYLNGEKLYEGYYNKEQWEKFVNEDLNNLKYFCIGRSSFNDDGQWNYTKMNAYALRLYNKALTEEQVKDNYQKSVIYHENITLGN